MTYVLDLRLAAKIALVSAVGGALTASKFLRSGQPWEDIEIAVAALHADLALMESEAGQRPAQVYMAQVQPFSGAELSGRWYWHVAMAPRHDEEAVADISTQMQTENLALEGWSWTYTGAQAGAEHALACMVQQAHEDEGCDGTCGGEIEECE